MKSAGLCILASVLPKPSVIIVSPGLWSTVLSQSHGNTSVAGDTVGFKSSGRIGLDIYHPGPGLAYLSKAPTGMGVRDYDGSGDWFKIAEIGLNVTYSALPGNEGKISWDLRGRYEFMIRIPERTPPGVAANVIAVVDLTAKVSTLLIQYGIKVQHAKDDIAQLQSQISCMDGALKRIQNLTQTNDVRLEATQEMLSALGNSEDLLAELKKKLKFSTKKKLMRRLGFRALKWPAALLELDQRDALNSLPTADGAAFDSHDEEHNATWKSTITRTVARAFDEAGILGASFFFKAGEAERSNVAKFYTTIAFQLASRHGAVTPHILKALNANPGVSGKAMKEQFENLILMPLVESRLRNLVIVVDALDECESDKDVKTLIGLFSDAKTSNLGLKVFLASRPDLPIRLGFKSIEGKYNDLVLHEIAEDIVEDDISTFLRHELAETRRIYADADLTEGWPGEPVIRYLSKKAKPLFIFAATMCRFINDENICDPEEQLRRILQEQIGKRKGLWVHQTPTY
ncbi:unnamed protein product [Parascedosporium putredinis]|uniref:Uncharacterized protein n=1 Tax=Parascedosporium putredinis TaxID=1442378 RepID=A0A9P1H641_9PEZI|nr:unnamed protein product [Parascedosporium putredinis]CAI7999893.1 unnamed protein product [Parascedosporium putredinis]